jgi:hypothetical protein
MAYGWAAGRDLVGVMKASERMRAAPRQPNLMGLVLASRGAG